MRLLKMDRLTYEAAAKLRPLARDCEWLSIVDDIACGRAELFLCPDRTFAVLRIDRATRELVIVALSGSGAVPLFEAAIAIARGNNLVGVRFHTTRRGLHRLLEPFGPVEVERVYRVAA